MSEPTHDAADEDAPLVDPADFGPEAIDGTRTGGDAEPPSDDEPGDPELHADPEDAPTS